MADSRIVKSAEGKKEIHSLNLCDLPCFAHEVAHYILRMLRKRRNDSEKTAESRSTDRCSCLFEDKERKNVIAEGSTTKARDTYMNLMKSGFCRFMSVAFASCVLSESETTI